MNEDDWYIDDELRTIPNRNQDTNENDFLGFGPSENFEEFRQRFTRMISENDSIIQSSPKKQTNDEWDKDWQNNPNWHK